MLTLLFLLACRPSPDVSSVTDILSAAAPIAWAGTLSWAAVKGEPGPCVQKKAKIPGQDPYALSLVASSDCPLALGEAPAGEAIVTVMEASSSTLLFAAAFGDLSLGTGTMPSVVDLAASTVTLRDDGLIVAWADENVAATPGSASVEQGAWTVFVDTNGTLADSSDDSIEVEGARQWVAAEGAGDEAVIVQTVVALARLEPGCRRNPVSGGAVLQAVQGNPESAGIDMGSVFFHDDCDGMARWVGGGSSGVGLGTEVEVEP